MEEDGLLRSERGGLIEGFQQPDMFDGGGGTLYYGSGHQDYMSMTQKQFAVQIGWLSCRDPVARPASRKRPRPPSSSAEAEEETEAAPAPSWHAGVEAKAKEMGIHVTPSDKAHWKGRQVAAAVQHVATLLFCWATDSRGVGATKVYLPNLCVKPVEVRGRRIGNALVVNVLGGTDKAKNGAHSKAVFHHEHAIYDFCLWLVRTLRLTYDGDDDRGRALRPCFTGISSVEDMPLPPVFPSRTLAGTVAGNVSACLYDVCLAYSVVFMCGQLSCVVVVLALFVGVG
jgi:hypothetical protein